MCDGPCGALALLLAHDHGRNREKPMLVRSPVPWGRGEGGRSGSWRGKEPAPGYGRPAAL